MMLATVLLSFINPNDTSTAIRKQISHAISLNIVFIVMVVLTVFFIICSDQKKEPDTGKQMTLNLKLYRATALPNKYNRKIKMAMPQNQIQLQTYIKYIIEQIFSIICLMIRRNYC